MLFGGQEEVGDQSAIAPEQSPNSMVAFGAATGQALNDFSFDFYEDTIARTSASDPIAMAKASSPTEAAKAFLGHSESNPEQNRALAAFIKEATGTSIDPSKTAWCAAFIDAVLRSNGSEGTGRLNARSYLNWGETVNEPKVGDVVVFSRGDPNGWQGHVGFYMGTNEDGTIKVLGGNQGNSVSEANYDASKVLGYRRPPNLG